MAELKTLSESNKYKQFFEVWNNFFFTNESGIIFLVLFKFPLVHNQTSPSITCQELEVAFLEFFTFELRIIFSFMLIYFFIESYFLVYL